MTNDQLREDFRNKTEPEWVRDMKAYYAQNGTYRAADLLRLLGDPTKGVNTTQNPSLAGNSLSRRD
jgi:hypothetical protein